MSMIGSTKRLASRIQKKSSSLSNPPGKGTIVPAIFIEAYDGDTITVCYRVAQKRRIGPSRKLYYLTNVRVYGIDTPEVSGNGVSELEKEAAILVRNYVHDLLTPYDIIYLHIMKNDKYGGRTVCQVILPPHFSLRRRFKRDLSLTPTKGVIGLANTLLEKGYGKPYKGNKKTKWLGHELCQIIDDLEDFSKF
jgi:endonuclease YncB( thermonuclease family)